MKRLHPSTLFVIEQKGLNDDDLHPEILSKPLIEDEIPNPTITPNTFFDYVKAFLGVLSNQTI